MFCVWAAGPALGRSNATISHATVSFPAVAALLRRIDAAAPLVGGRPRRARPAPPIPHRTGSRPCKPTGAAVGPVHRRG
jgi:hypothetical protein